MDLTKITFVLTILMLLVQIVDLLYLRPWYHRANNDLIVQKKNIKTLYDR